MSITSQIKAILSFFTGEQAPKVEAPSPGPKPVMGYMRVGLPTRRHAEYLRKKGYHVAEAEGLYMIETAGFIDELDLSQGIEPLKELAQARKAMSHKTRVTLPGGRVVQGVRACFSLGPAGCLFMSPKDPNVKKSVHQYDF